MRVIGADGAQVGIMPTYEAMKMAEEQGLELVEVNPRAAPPVCRIMDFGKFKYETSKKEKASRKHQSTVVVKEVKFRPKTDIHDLDFKVKHIRRFLTEGNKCRLVIVFRGRGDRAPGDRSGDARNGHQGPGGQRHGRAEGDHGRPAHGAHSRTAHRGDATGRAPCPGRRYAGHAGSSSPQLGPGRQRPGRQRPGRPDGRPGTQAGTRPGTQAGTRRGTQAGRPGTQAGRPGTRPGTQAGRPGTQAGGRPAPKPAAAPAPKQASAPKKA